VTVTVDDGYLVIRGERKRKEELKEEDVYRMEASYGTFERRIHLPRGVEGKPIKAKHTDGVWRSWCSALRGSWRA
jgi:HSP20 family protein